MFLNRDLGWVRWNVAGGRGKRGEGGRGEGEEGGEAELDHAKEAVAAKTVVSLCLQQAG